MQKTGLSMQSQALNGYKMLPFFDRTQPYSGHRMDLCWEELVFAAAPERQVVNKVQARVSLAHPNF